MGDVDLAFRANALALVAKHPEQVRILVAHEPPAAQELPDREAVLAACEGIKETYLREGFGPAMAKFIALVSCPPKAQRPGHVLRVADEGAGVRIVRRRHRLRRHIANATESPRAR